MDPATTPDDDADEREFAALPEALRLHLLDFARREVGAGAMPLQQIAEAAGIPYGTAHRRLKVALLKLRHRAEKIDF
jgi:hypothetical protein